MRAIEPSWILKPGVIDPETGWVDPDMARLAKRVKGPSKAVRRLRALCRAMRTRGRELVDQVRLGAAIAGSVIAALASELAPRQMRVAL